MRKQEGFTLPDMLIALCIYGMVIAAALSAYLMGISIWRAEGTRQHIQRQGALALEAMTRGGAGLPGLREADLSSFAFYPSGATDGFQVDVDAAGPVDQFGPDRTVRFYRSGRNILFDPDAGSAGDERPLFRDPVVESFAVERNGPGNLVTLSLELKETVRSKKAPDDLVNVNLRTSVLIRND